MELVVPTTNQVRTGPRHQSHPAELMLFFYEFIFSINAAKPKAKINQSRYSVAIAGVSNISIPPYKASKNSFNCDEFLMIRALYPPKNLKCAPLNIHKCILIGNTQGW
ncbi:MAG: hypothetical protein COB71_01785 [Thiotrichales bacterium]|nr:MAG: hypothetical protein COB71_01785 [Thiotrichales bacterium]